MNFERFRPLSALAPIWLLAFFQLWTFNFAHERRTRNPRLRLVAPGHPCGHLRPRRDGDLFRYTRQFADRHAREASALADHRFRPDVRALAAGLSLDTLSSASPLSHRSPRSRRGSP